MFIFYDIWLKFKKSKLYTEITESQRHKFQMLLNDVERMYYKRFLFALLIFIVLIVDVAILGNFISIFDKLETILLNLGAIIGGIKLFKKRD